MRDAPSVVPDGSGRVVGATGSSGTATSKTVSSIRASTSSTGVVSLGSAVSLASVVSTGEVVSERLSVALTRPGSSAEPSQAPMRGRARGSCGQPGRTLSSQAR